MRAVSPSKQKDVNVRRLSDELVDSFSLDELKVIHRDLTGPSRIAKKLELSDAIAACESGKRISGLRSMLESLDDQLLPDQVETFLDRIETRSQAVQRSGEAILFYCADSKVASDVAAHALAKDVCMLAGKNHLVVKACFEDKFRRALRVIGYGTAIAMS